jgi:DUF971 family protein
MGPSAEVTDVTVTRDVGVQVVYADGRVCDFGLVELRLKCPCATCRSDLDNGRDPWPKSHSPLPLRIADAQLHGAWGLSVEWNDGHSTGIYAWEYLRAWCEAGHR